MTSIYICHDTVHSEQNAPSVSSSVKKQETIWKVPYCNIILPISAPECLYFLYCPLEALTEQRILLSLLKLTGIITALIMYWSAQETLIGVISGILKEKRLAALRNFTFHPGNPVSLHFLCSLSAPLLLPSRLLSFCTLHSSHSSHLPMWPEAMAEYGAKRSSEEVVIVNPSGVIPFLPFSSHPPLLCSFPSNCDSYATVFNPEVQTDGHI